MVDPNARTDYAKLRQLLQFDTLDQYRKGIIFQIAQDGYIYN